MIAPLGMFADDEGACLLFPGGMRVVVANTIEEPAAEPIRYYMGGERRLVAEVVPNFEDKQWEIEHGPVRANGLHSTREQARWDRWPLDGVTQFDAIIFGVIHLNEELQETMAHLAPLN